MRASYGHVRDLPESADEIPDEIRKKKWGRLGVDTDGDFKPYYVDPERQAEARAGAEGGAQGRHAGAARDRPRSRRRVDQLAPARRSSSRRCRSSASSFTRSPKDAIHEAVKDAHDVDENLVRAQESRRILDRLYGYTLSPVLWKKVQTGLSAGRVQSVAVRLIVDREEERLAFRPATYWDLEARLSGDGREFTATLARLGDDARRDRQGLRLERRADRQERARAVGGRRPRARRRALARICRGRSRRSTRSRASSGPAPPFTTSTLTQEASRKLGFSTERTMQAAQRLFQDGHISYHRTDSTTLSEKALGGVGGGDSRDVRRRVLLRAAPLRDESEERAGGARGDPADRISAATPASLEARARSRRPAASTS